MCCCSEDEDEPDSDEGQEEEEEEEGDEEGAESGGEHVSPMKRPEAPVESRPELTPVQVGSRGPQQPAGPAWADRRPVPPQRPLVQSLLKVSQIPAGR